MSYQPNKAIHPGVTVSHILVNLGMTQKSLSERTGITEKHISSIINGDASITPETAALFANALGGTPSFWNNLQKRYEETKVRLENEKFAQNEVNLLGNFPYNELKKRGYVPDVKDKLKKVLELWRFYGVNSLKSVQSIESIAWRRGATEKVKAESLSAWLRCGELEANELTEKIKIEEFNENKLRSLLPKVRNCTYSMVSDFWNNLQKEFASAGVILIAVEHFPGTRANGATRWIGGNPVIQLSAYGRNADGVWFTLMHEIGHVLKHGKKDKFISFNNGREKSTTEIEADEFAAETLIPKKDYDVFVSSGDFSRGSIIEFAKSQEIHPGVVVGRLKNHGLIDFNKYLDMHGKLTVVGDKSYKSN